MKIFTNLSEIGPCIEVYSIQKFEFRHILHRATTGEYVLETICAPDEQSKTRIISEAQAIQWSVNNGLCKTKAEFYSKIWTVLCTLAAKPQPQAINPLLFDCVCGFSRYLQLLQLPVFREAVVLLPDGISIERVLLASVDHLAVSAWTHALTEGESFICDTVLSVGPTESFKRLFAKSSIHEYEASWGTRSVRAKCGYALASFQYPLKINTKISTGVWIELVECECDIDTYFLCRIVESAYGVLFSAILLYETITLTSEDPTQVPPNNGILDF